MDTQRLKASWARVGAHGDRVAQYFYSLLFVARPELRVMFPVSMASQRDRLVGALGRVLSNVDDVGPIVPFVQGLGRDHRKFGVQPEHFPMVGQALLETLAYFEGEAWTAELAADWTAAYELVAGVMVESAQQAAEHTPAWWEAELVSHERRGLDVAVLHLRPRPHYPYRPGQSCSVETPYQPTLWRYFSPANAPRSDGLIELHVKSVPGGQVSPALVHRGRAGDVLRLGAPVGEQLTLDPAGDGDLVMLAGSTGLAPLKALIEQLALEGGHRRRVSLFFGARTGRDLYDLPALEEMARRLPWLSVVPVLSNDSWHLAEQGLVVEAALRYGTWTGQQVYVCGSAPMVAGTVEHLIQAGVPADRIRSEDYTHDPYRPGGDDDVVAEALAVSEVTR